MLAVWKSEFLVWQPEVHCDLRLDLDWLAIEVIRLVLPLANCIGCSASEYTISVEHGQIRDASFFADRSKKLNCTLNAHLHSRGGVNRLDPFED